MVCERNFMCREDREDIFRNHMRTEKTYIPALSFSFVTCGADMPPHPPLPLKLLKTFTLPKGGRKAKMPFASLPSLRLARAWKSIIPATAITGVRGPKVIAHP